MFRRAFWYVHQAPNGQKAHVPKYPPDIRDSLVRGTPTNSVITDQRFDFLEQNFTHRDGDVWVVTYQKVGTTWTQYILSLVLGHPRVGSLIDLFGHCPWPEIGFGIIGTSEEALQRSASTATRARCFKSHWPRKDFFATLPETSKVIYVYRDAESVAVSYWNHMFNFFVFYWLEEGDMTWDQFFEKWFNGDLQNGDYFEHVASWWALHGQPNALFLRFEDLMLDTPGTVKRIAAFAGVELSETLFAETLDATSRDNMRKWNEGWIDMFLIKMGCMKGDMVRKEGANQQISCSTEQRARMVKKYEDVLQPLGVPFDDIFKDKK